MRLGISSWTYAWAIGVPGHTPTAPLSALDLVHCAAELGVHVVQLADNLPLHTCTPHELAGLERASEQLGVAIEVGTRGLQPDHLASYLRLAARLGSPILRVVVDAGEDRPSVDEIIRRIGPQIPALQAAGVTLAIENHDRLPTGDLTRILETLASPWVGICLDTVNSFGALEGPAVVVEALAPWTVNLHIKDFAITRASSQMGFSVEGRPAGQGRLDIPWLLETVQRHGRDPNAILELWTPWAGDLASTIDREATWARESVAYLRTLLKD